jgi:hypothetical protein
VPVDQQRLLATLGAMRAEVVTDPDKAVRSQRFIRMLHEVCVAELAAHVAANDRVRVVPECNIFGARTAKDVDIGVLDKDNGPLILVGVRSQMSSVGKNIKTYVEQIIGELAGLRQRFPMCVMGYLYLLPTSPIKPGKEDEGVPLDLAEYLFSQITLAPGQDHRIATDVFDHFAYLVVDFSANPPVISPDWPTAAHPHLRIDSFFDSLVETFKQRNLFLPDLFH